MPECTESNTTASLLVSTTTTPNERRTHAIKRSPSSNHNNNNNNNRISSSSIKPSTIFIFVLFIVLVVVSFSFITLLISIRSNRVGDSDAPSSSHVVAFHSPVRQSHTPAAACEPQHEEQQQQRRADVCRTNTCYQAANFILENLNQTAEPCDDFYVFACGNRDSHFVEETDHFSIAYENMLNEVSEALGDPVIFHHAENDQHDDELANTFKTFYRSCLNISDIEANADAQFMRLMRSEIGPWSLVPILEAQAKHDENDDDVEDVAQFSASTRLGIEAHLFKLTYLDMPLVFDFESSDFNHTSIQMQLFIVEDFCKMQQLLPNTTSSRQRFLKMVKVMRDLMFESINGVDFYTAAEKSSSFVNTSLYDTPFEAQVDEMLRLANRLYFLNDSRYHCHKKGGGTTQNKKEYSLLTIDELNERVNKSPSNRSEKVILPNRKDEKFNENFFVKK